MTETRRGRPPTPTPRRRRAGRIGGEDRVAWLLRCNRLLGPDNDMAIGSKFARAFGRSRVGGVVDPSQVTRWELVYHRADYRVLRRYEELLHLPAHTLVTVADTIYRESVGRPGAPPLSRTIDPDSDQIMDRTGLLLEQALSTDAMTGHDWDELTANIIALPRVLLVPRRAWNDLADRLLAEMIIADGSDWTQRLEGVNRLLGHRHGQAAVVAACTALAADRTNQVFIEPLTVLEMCPHPDAARHLVRQVVGPTNDHARRGAWLAVAEKMGRGHFGEADITTLSRHAVEVLSDDNHITSQLAAADLLRQVPRTMVGQTEGRLLSAIRGNVATRNVLHSGRTAPAESTATVVANIRSAAIRWLPRDVLEPDRMLDAILEDLLFHPHITRKVIAAQLIAATPYRNPIALALGAELRRRSVLADPPLAISMISGLPRPGEVDIRQTVVEDLVLASGIAPAIGEAAAWKLGHIHAAIAESFWNDAFARHLPRASTASGASTVRGLVYALGRQGRATLLRRLQGDVTLPAPVRTAATWWLNIPDHVLRSVT
jgi:hypothetical protein